jgi:hypothetical protein
MTKGQERLNREVHSETPIAGLPMTPSKQEMGIRTLREVHAVWRHELSM